MKVLLYFPPAFHNSFGLWSRVSNLMTVLNICYFMAQEVYFLSVMQCYNASDGEAMSKGQ